jgi:hypothetical protein
MSAVSLYTRVNSRQLITSPREQRQRRLLQYWHGEQMALLRRRCPSTLRCWAGCSVRCCGAAVRSVTVLECLCRCTHHTPPPPTIAAAAADRSDLTPAQAPSTPVHYPEPNRAQRTGTGPPKPERSGSAFFLSQRSLSLLPTERPSPLAPLPHKSISLFLRFHHARRRYSTRLPASPFPPCAFSPPLAPLLLLGFRRPIRARWRPQPWRRRRRPTQVRRARLGRSDPGLVLRPGFPSSSSRSLSLSVPSADPLYPELWRACAGPLVNVPRHGDLVYYFPQGHIEQVTRRLTPLPRLSLELPSADVPRA